MDKRHLGKSELTVSKIGLGCMGLSHAYGEPTERKAAVRFVQEAYEKDYTFFDTAEIYGTHKDPHDNETMLGEAIKPFRDKVVIATKFGIQFDAESEKVPYPIVTNSHPDKIRESVENSLKRLQTDYIDLYYQHRIDPQIPPEEVAGVMSELIQEGKIRCWGISEATEDVIRHAHKTCPITAIQNRYSIMYRDYESLFPVLEELEIGFVPFSPLANGLLSDRYNQDTTFSQTGDYRIAMPQFKKEAFDANEALFQLIRSTAEEKNATPAQISLAWMLCKQPWIVPIPGTRKLNRLEENAEAADIYLTEKEIRSIDNALDNMEMSKVFGMK